MNSLIKQTQNKNQSVKQYWTTRMPPAQESLGGLQENSKVLKLLVL